MLVIETKIMAEQQKRIRISTDSYTRLLLLSLKTESTKEEVMQKALLLYDFVWNEMLADKEFTTPGELDAVEWMKFFLEHCND